MQIHETAKRLKERGHTVDIQNSDKPNIKDADIVHIFNSVYHLNSNFWNAKGIINQL